MSKFKTLALCALMGVWLTFTACDDSPNSAANSQNATNSSANSAANGENSANSAANSAQNSQNGVNLSQNSAQNLSKYRALYAKPTSEWAKPELDPSVEKEWQEFAPVPRTAPAPDSNKFESTKAHLGRSLFRDPRLSKSGQFSCESCHHKELESSDGLPVAFGHDFQTGRRNTPSSQMAGFFDELFWDGRAKGLEEQALVPITDPVEMANTLENATRAIKNAPEYYPYFVAAFGDEGLKNAWGKYYAWVAPKSEPEVAAAKKAVHTNMPEAQPPKKPDYLGIERVEGLDAAALNALREQEDELFNSWDFRRLLRAQGARAQGAKPPKVPQNLINSAKKLITIENIAKAIATFERGPGVMGARNSRFERFIKGDYEILSDKELWGLDLFRNKGRCMNCHYGFLLSDKKFHNIGLDLYGRAGQDLGRYEVTRNPADIGAFKTPTLVNVAKTAPYMHNGSSPNLKGVIQLFNNGVEVPAVNDANLTAIAQRDGANVAGGGILSAEGVKNSAGGGSVNSAAAGAGVSAGANSSATSAGVSTTAAGGANSATGANSSVAAGKNAASVAVERKKLVVDKDGKVLKPTKSPLIHPLNLSADEIEALEAFLKTL